MRFKEFRTLQEDNQHNATIASGFYEPEEDHLEQQRLSNTHKPKVTLKTINRLKKVRSAKRVEVANKQKVLGIMYGAPAGDEEDSM